MNRDKQHIVELYEDVASGNLVTDIPQEILNDLGWYEGTVVEWVIDGTELILKEVCT